MEKIVDQIGFFGPQILFIISVISLWKQQAHFYGYLVFLMINKIINKILKLLIKQPRPNHGKSIIENEDRFYVGIEQYGMPSGHMQSCFYSLTYLYLVKQSPTITIVEMFITSLTFYQRWKYNRHTIEQLCVGSVVGILVGYLSFIIVNRYLRTQ